MAIMSKVLLPADVGLAKLVTSHVFSSALNTQGGTSVRASSSAAHVSSMNRSFCSASAPHHTPLSSACSGCLDRVPISVADVQFIFEAVSCRYICIHCSRGAERRALQPQSRHLQVCKCPHHGSPWMCLRAGGTAFHNARLASNSLVRTMLRILTAVACILCAEKRGSPVPAPLQFWSRDVGGRDTRNTASWCAQGHPSARRGPCRGTLLSESHDRLINAFSYGSRILHKPSCL